MSPERESGETRAGLIIIGSVTAAVTTFSQRLPRPGETVLGDDVSLVLGGKGANQAVAGARAGAQTFFVGCVGNDLFQDLVLGGLFDNDVEVSETHVVVSPTGLAHLRVDSSGENDSVVVPLANGHRSIEHVDAALARLAPRSSVMITQLEIPSAVSIHAIRTARALGLTVILDPAPAVALEPDIWRHIDIVTPNETEASLITGIPVTDFASAVEAGRWLCDRGAGHAIITLASAGAALVSSEHAIQFEAFPIDTVDTTAAGDAFTGYLGAGLAQNLDLTDAVTRAMAAGALAVSRRGASPSLPTLDEVNAFLAGQRGREVHGASAKAVS